MIKVWEKIKDYHLFLGELWNFQRSNLFSAPCTLPMMAEKIKADLAVWAAEWPIEMLNLA